MLYLVTLMPWFFLLIFKCFLYLLLFYCLKHFKNRKIIMSPHVQISIIINLILFYPYQSTHLHPQSWVFVNKSQILYQVRHKYLWKYGFLFKQLNNTIISCNKLIKIPHYNQISLKCLYPFVFLINVFFLFFICFII